MSRFVSLTTGCLAIVVCGSAFGDEPAEKSPAGSANEWVVTGTVVNEAGEPVAGASVRWIGDLDKAATTNEAGEFRLPLGIPEPDYHWAELWVTKEGNPLLANYVLESARDVEAPQPVHVVLKPAKKLTVTVVDEDGQPVEGAKVAFMPRITSVVTGKTNGEGVWTGMISAEAPHWRVIARKSGVGFDYARIEGGTNNMSPDPTPESVRLVLDGARSLRVKVVDMNGEPLEGIPVSPSRILRHYESSTGLASFFSTVSLDNDDRFATKTGPAGIAVLDWLPSKFQGNIAVSTDTIGEFYIYLVGDFGLNGRTIAPGDGIDELTLRLCPYQTISGRVTYADGSPAAGISLDARGEGIARMNGSAQTTTDANGQYELNLPAEQAYYIRIADDEWTAPLRWPLVLRIDRPLASIDFTLMPATKFHGRITAGTSNIPVEDLTIRMIRRLGRVPDEISNLARAGSHQSHTLSVYLSARTNDNGQYEFALAPGEYTVRYPGGNMRGEDVELAVPKEDTPAEIEKNFHLKRGLEGPLTVHVVDQEGNPVPKATLTGEYRAYTHHSWYRPVNTDENGTYKTTRALEKLIIHGVSSDGNLQGIAHVDATASEVTLVLGPTITVTGTVVDDEGQPLANKSVGYTVNIYMGPPETSAFIERFGGSAMSNAKGHFELEGVVPGQKYVLSVELSENMDVRVRTFKSADNKSLDLGKVEAAIEPSRLHYVPPTPAERTAQYFQAPPDDSVADRLEKVLDSARHMYMTPLVIVGRPDDPASIELIRRFYEDSLITIVKQSVQDMRWEFELLALDMERKDVQQWAKQLGVSTDEKDLPVLLALNTQGEIIGRLKIAYLTEPVVAPIPGRNTPAEPTLLSFLQERKRPVRNAQTMLTEAFVTAAAQDKNVFLICSASWCGPCRMLAEFLDPYHKELQQDYIFVHLDVSRDTHAQDINQKYKGDRSGGVPWYVILDPEGNELISSNLPTEEDKEEDEKSKYPTTGRNIGAVGGAKSIDHFMKMIKTTSDEIDEEVLKKMRADLEGDR